MQDQRQNPAKWLQQAEEEARLEARGKLKIYLGAAPGVGKTYTMLNDSLLAREKGLDVVVGIAESHGREDIEVMLKKLEALPRVQVEYRERKLPEFDLDGALKRHPALILVDEMAHTNVPGLRHNKRWQDIKELLDRGIDVYTTLNVQHIESLSDDVAKIIQVPIKETVPDSMIDMANTIELVDLPPEELLKRLHEGKVYFPEQAEIAKEMYFRKGNLIALRELALRVTAELVEAQVLLYRQGQGIQTVWPTKEKMLIVVEPGEESSKLIRRAKRMAASLQAEWICVYVDSSYLKHAEENRIKAVRHLRFAEKMGADTRILTGMNRVDDIMKFAREENVTQIIVWKEIHSRWHQFFFPDLADGIVRQSGDIDVYVMTGTSTKKEVKPELTLAKKPIKWWSYLASILVVVAATAVDYYLIMPFMSSSNLVMVYLLAITLVAVFGARGPSILTSVLSVLAYDFFFIPPFFSFAVSDPKYFFTLAVMLMVGQVITHLTFLTRRQAESASASAHRVSALYTLSRQLANTRGSDHLLNKGVKYISAVFDCDVMGLLPKEGQLKVRAESPAHHVLDDKEQGIVEWVYELGQMAGLGTDSLSFSEALFMPLQGSQSVMGVLRVQPKHTERFLEPENIHLLEACANQVAFALEVDRLQEINKTSELKLETDRVRNAMLKAFSQDLRTPLRAIIEAATSQMQMASDLDPESIMEFGKDIYLETEQLSRLVNNMLQATYFEYEPITLHKEVHSLRSVIMTMLQASERKIGQRPIHIDIPDDLPRFPFDKTLIQEVLVNLLDNAIKFTPRNSPIDILVSYDANTAVVSVIDHGPGILTDEIDRLFDKFYRGRLLTKERGLGLGLAICYTIVTAHGGVIWVENAEQGGAVFSFSLPMQ